MEIELRNWKGGINDIWYGPSRNQLQVACGIIDEWVKSIWTAIIGKNVRKDSTAEVMTNAWQCKKVKDKQENLQKKIC